MHLLFSCVVLGAWCWCCTTAVGLGTRKSFGLATEEGELVETGDLEKRQENITLKAPIIAPPSQHWEGTEGSFSTFEIRIGTPPQTFRVLPATSWQETWVVYGTAVDACNVSVGVPSDCADARGGFFDFTKSGTWREGEQNELGLNAGLGFEGVGVYGLGFHPSTGPTLPSQLISAIVSPSFYLGILGLGFQPTNQTNFTSPIPSFSRSLFDKNMISSQSWSYTAGAIYRLKGVFGSLIFGGYDKARFVHSDKWFSMSGDNLRDLVVTIRGIKTGGSLDGGNRGGEKVLMEKEEFAFIDSSLTSLYLPPIVCTAFEKAFGLILDVPSGSYLLNTTQHETLLALNPNITISLSDQKSIEGSGSDEEIMDFTLPYAAFDLQVSPPNLANRTSRYFPLKRAPEGGIALGRVFLQEVGVVAHYDSRTFQVLKSRFENSMEHDIVALPPILPTLTPSPSPSSTPTPGGGGKTDPSNNSNSGLGAGAIAGIVLGIIALLIILLSLFCLHKRRKTRLATLGAGKRGSTPTAEIDTGKRIGDREQSKYAGQTSAFTSEMQGQSAKVEIGGNPIMHPQELEGVPVVVAMGLSSNRLGARTPMAELGEDEARGGDGFSPVGGGGSGLGSKAGSGRRREGEKGSDEVSEMGDDTGSNSYSVRRDRDTMVSLLTPVDATGSSTRGIGAPNGISETRVGSGGRWSPTTSLSPTSPSNTNSLTESTTLERRKSRFEERFGD